MLSLITYRWNLLIAKRKAASCGVFGMCGKYFTNLWKYIPIGGNVKIFMLLRVLHSSYSKSCLQSAILKLLCQPSLALSEMKLHVSSTFQLQSTCIRNVILIYIIKIFIFWRSSIDIAYFVFRCWLLYQTSVTLTCLVRKPCICSFLKWKILILILFSISTI